MLSIRAFLFHGSFLRKFSEPHLDAGVLRGRALPPQVDEGCGGAADQDGRQARNDEAPTPLRQVLDSGAQIRQELA